MNTLKIGSSGPEVKSLQQALLKAGFRPGKADGDFGPGVEAAVMAFQRANGLLPDGVAGPVTLQKLGLVAPDAPMPSVVPQITPELVAKMFPGTPLKNIKANLPGVLAALEEFGLVSKPMMLMALATIRAESASFLPVKEGVSRYNTSPGGRPFDLYDFRKDIGNNKKGDGDRFAGRGYVQLTGGANYLVHGEKLGLGDQLVRNPDLACDPEIAGRILASFLKSVELKAKQALLEGDLKLARRYVNGGSHGLNAFSEAYRTGDRLIAA